MAFIAGIVRGFSGFGGPAVMILCLVPFYSPVSVLSKVAMIDLSANIKLLPSTWNEVNWHTTGWFVATAVVGIPIGMYALNTVDPIIMKRVIAGVAACGTVVMLIGWRLTRMPPLWVTILVSFAAGIILGATMIAFVAVVYLLLTPAPAAETRANIVYWGFPTTVLLIVYHAGSGNIVWNDVWLIAVICLVHLGGTIAGARAFRLVSEVDYRRTVLWFLLGLAVLGLLL